MLNRLLTVMLLLLSIAMSVMYFKITALEAEFSRVTVRLRIMDRSVERQQDVLERLERTSDRIRSQVKRLEANRRRLVTADTTANTTPRSESREALKVAGVEAAVVGRVEQGLEARISEIVARPRTGQGEWIAPVDELAQVLELAPEDAERVTQVFNAAHDASFELLSQTREDGGSMLDDLVENLRELGHPRGFQHWLGRLGQTNVPEGDGTYVQAYGALRDEVLLSLKSTLTADQMRRFEESKVAPLRVDTGYDPVRRYVESALE